MHMLLFEYCNFATTFDNRNEKTRSMWLLGHEKFSDTSTLSESEIFKWTLDCVSDRICCGLYSDICEFIC